MLPTELFPGYAFDGTDITIPLADLAALSSAEANATTGDGREVLRALLDAAYTNYNGLATKPSKMSMTKPNPALATGASGQFRQTYTAVFDLAPTGLQMASEPA